MGATDAKHLTDDCMLFSSCAETVELLLLGAFEVERHDESLEEVADALEEGIEHMLHLSEGKWSISEALKKVPSR